jgi:hypothetical protein
VRVEVDEARHAATRPGRWKAAGRGPSGSRPHRSLGSGSPG